MAVGIEGVLLKDGRRAQGYFVDQNAVHMHKASRDDDDLALYSQTMLEKVGHHLRRRNLSRLRYCQMQKDRVEINPGHSTGNTSPGNATFRCTKLQGKQSC